MEKLKFSSYLTGQQIYINSKKNYNIHTIIHVKLDSNTILRIYINNVGIKKNLC